MSAQPTELRATIRTFLDLFALPPVLTVAEWADQFRYLSSESSSKRGKWKSLPFQIKPMEDVTAPDVRCLVLMWASQITGKTEIVNNSIGRFIDLDPCPILVLQPTVEMAEAWSKERLAPMLRDTPRLRGRIRDAKSRDSNNTILHKAFPGGHLSIVGANAPAGLAARPIRILACDEVDRYPASAGVEGDPISLAQKRTESFHDAVEIDTSTPTVKGVSRIESKFELSDKNYFFCPCPKCGEFQILKWSQVKFEFEQPDGTTKRDVKATVYVCDNPACGSYWTDTERVEAIHKGEWRATAPFNGVRGYHLNGIYCLFKAQKGFINRLHQMAEKFLEAKHGGPETLKTWTNTFLAETWEEDGDKPEAAPLLARCENYGAKLPEGVLVLVAGIDVHPKYWECEIVGFGAGDETWGIRYDHFTGNAESPKDWEQVDQWLQQKFEHANGTMLSVACCCIDSANTGKAVYAFVRPRQVRRVFAVKGSSTAGGPIVARPKKSGVRSVDLFMVGTDTAKGMIYSRLKLPPGEPGYMHFPNGYGYNKEYFDGLTAEKCVTEYLRGFPKRVWKKDPPSARNEPLDCRVYAYAAREILNPSYVHLAKNLAKKAETVLVAEDTISKTNATDAKPDDSQPVQKIARPMRRQNWVSGWRKL